MIPYGRHSIDEDDIRAVNAVLQSDWLTTGPKVAEFEHMFANFVGAKEAVAVSSGTAALHAAMYALGIGSGDEVIVPAMTFAATANCVVYQGGTPVFVDVDGDSLLIDPEIVKSKITSRTRAIIAVDYAGQPADYDRLRSIAEKRGIPVVADACHSLGASYKGQSVGSLAVLNTFSFHPVKHITTAEGGMVTTDDSDLSQKMRNFRNHGITTDHHQRESEGSWFYEMVDLGYNYRLTDVQCALGISQLQKLSGWVGRRQAIAELYNEAFSKHPLIRPLVLNDNISHAYHLYVIRIDFTKLPFDRAKTFASLRSKGIGVNVHYIPVHLHPYYQRRLGTRVGLCPVAEAAYEQILTLPMHSRLTDQDIDTICRTIQNVLGNG